MFSFLYDGRLGEMLAPTLSNDQLLYSACCNGNEDKVEALLAEEGINVQYRDGATARTLLHGACRSGSAELVDRLIGLGVDVRLAAHDGTTALHIAAQRGAADIVAKLIAKGADPLARDQAGQTPHAMCANYDLKKVLLRHMFPSQAREAPTAGAPPTSGAASAAVVAGGAAAAVEGNAAGAAAAGAMPPTEGEGAGGAGATPSASDAPPGEESGPPRSRLIQPDGFKTTVGDRALSTAFGNHATPAAGGFGSAPPPTDQAQQDAGASMWMSSGAPPRSTPRGYAGFSNPYSQSTQPAQMSMSKTPPSTPPRFNSPFAPGRAAPSIFSPLPTAAARAVTSSLASVAPDGAAATAAPAVSAATATVMPDARQTSAAAVAALAPQQQQHAAVLTDVALIEVKFEEVAL